LPQAVCEGVVAPFPFSWAINCRKLTTHAEGEGATTPCRRPGGNGNHGRAGPEDPAVQRASSGYAIISGRWRMEEHFFTGTGFPGCFYSNIIFTGTIFRYRMARFGDERRA